MSIGENIKRLRKEKKISADYIGKKADKSGKQWIYDIEKGIIERISDDDLEKIAKALDVTVNELRENKATSNTSQEKPEIYVPKIGNDIRHLTGFKEKYYFLIEENRQLWKENAYLKSLLLKHKIEVYNTDSQNETP